MGAEDRGLQWCGHVVADGGIQRGHQFLPTAEIGYRHPGLGEDQRMSAISGDEVPIFEADVWDHVDMTQLAHCLRAPCQGIALDHLGHAHAFGREQGLVGFAESMAQGIGREPLLELGVVAVRGQMRQVGGKPEQPVETGLLGRAVGDP